ncbi:MAG TPA: carbohydrate-binding domain-containing protein, partial [Clostridium sp.]
NGVNITCSNSAPIYVKNAKKTIISSADNTENIIKDGENYVFESGSADEPNAAIFSKSDLIFIGNGSLTVDGKYKNGITSKDDLKIQSGDITINAVDDGLKGKDSVAIANGNITITSGKDGIVSSNDEDAKKGYVLVENGKINITSGQDGIQAETNAFVKAGDITINSGGGSKNAPVKEEKGPGMGGKQFDPNAGNAGTSTTETATAEEESTSTKAIKAGVNIITEGGTFNIDSMDDAFHSNNNLVINDGTFNVSAGDDGIHADATLTVNDGNINIVKAYEGVESENITINNGEISLIASDDGINASSSSEAADANGGTASSGKEPSGTGILNINGGKINVNAQGDGLDANGSAYMKGGTVIVNGPTADGNGALDYDGTFTLTGGTLIAAGSSGMAQAPSTESTQNSIKVTLAAQTANTLVRIESEDGEEILTFAPSKQFASVVVSSPKFKTGSTYKVYVGGSSTGTVTGGVYSDGTYTKGEEVGSATISGSVTEITQEGVTVSGPGGHGGGQGGFRGQGGSGGKRAPVDGESAPQDPQQ